MENTLLDEAVGEMTQLRRNFEVAIDARWLRGGLGTYTYHLLAGLSKLRNGLTVRAIVSQHSAAVIAPLCDSLRIVNAPIYTVREQIQIPVAARGCDLLHVPHYNVPVAYRGPLVATIHDLTHLLDETYVRSLRSWYARPMYNFVAHRADHILTVSNYSRERIIERLNVNPSKVTVTYPGVAPQFRPLDRETVGAALSASLRISVPYLLFVGNLKPHKNVPVLLQAFRDLMSIGLGHSLILIGDDRQGRSLVAQHIQELGLGKRVRVLPSVDAGSLVELYAAAAVLVLPSLEEGFGSPVVEAMACGTPVVCSRAASLPEVGGDAAEYFDPRSREELVAVLRRVLGSEAMRSRMSQRGLAQAKRFNYDACAAQHYQVYRRLAC